MGREQFEPQVPKDHYLFKNYDTKERWMSYWYQVKEVLDTGSTHILEVGVGNGTVSEYLRQAGLTVTTVDIDLNLKPDYVGSVIELTKLFPSNAFDLILCAQVLEHIPFELFEKALAQLYLVTREYVLISLPYAGVGIRLLLGLPKLGGKNSKIKFPLFFAKHTFDGQHYWELGKRKYSVNSVIKIMEQKFHVLKHYYPAENMYHMLFLLKKR